MRVHVGLPLLATHPVSPPPPLPTGHLESSRSGSSDTRPGAGSSPEFRISHKYQPEETLTSGRPLTDPAGADRYCSDCKIQFSSFKTYQVHKQHYCQSRKTSVAGSLPAVSPVPILEKPPVGDVPLPLRANPGAGSGGPMTILMLPTHPPIVIPLCILQSARLLTADQPMPPHSVIVSPHGDIQFRTDSPEEPRPVVPTSVQSATSTVSSSVTTNTTTSTPAVPPASPAAVPAIPSTPATPVPAATVSAANPPVEPSNVASPAHIPPETALDLSSKAPEPEEPTSAEVSVKEPSNRGESNAEMTIKDTQPKENSSKDSTTGSSSSGSGTGGIRIREELAHVNQNSPDHPSQQQQQQQQHQLNQHGQQLNPALPFLPPKVFAELEALGMCLGVPSGHDMTSNPAQWLAMLENAVLQASFHKTPPTTTTTTTTSSALLSPSNQTDLINQAQRPSSAIPCEECNISFRRMESYLVHKQYYCAARHQPAAGSKELVPPPTPTNPESVNGNQTEAEVVVAPAVVVAARDPVIQRANKHACPLCGIEFESAVVLQAHRSFYCPKRDVDPSPTAKNQMPDVRKNNPEVTSASPNPPSGPSPNNNGMQTQYFEF